MWVNSYSLLNNSCYSAVNDYNYVLYCNTSYVMYDCGMRNGDLCTAINWMVITLLDS